MSSVRRELRFTGNPLKIRHSNSTFLTAISTEKLSNKRNFFFQMYGQDPQDIARFGVLPPCHRKDRHRCVQPKTDTGWSAKSTVEPERHVANGGQFFSDLPLRAADTPGQRIALSGLPPVPPGQRIGAPPGLTLAGADQNIRLVPCVEPVRCPGQRTFCHLIIERSYVS